MNKINENILVRTSAAGQTHWPNLCSHYWGITERLAAIFLLESTFKHTSTQGSIVRLKWTSRSRLHIEVLNQLFTHIDLWLNDLTISSYCILYNVCTPHTHININDNFTAAFNLTSLPRKQIPKKTFAQNILVLIDVGLQSHRDRHF